MKTFVRVSEVWVPTGSRGALELGQGSYGDLDAFAELSRSMRFEYDVGLPGKAWARRRPVVLRSFENSYFQRTAAAHAAGLATAIAIPIFAGDVLTSVLVLFCADDPDLVGAIEIWDDRERHDGLLRLSEGFYGAASAFEWISKSASFRVGHGLPGIVWASGMPRVLPDLGRTSHFLRADAALKLGIEHGLGIPCGGGHTATSVVTFLSSCDTPIAHRFEVWIPSSDRKGLVFHEGYCDFDPDIDAHLAKQTVESGSGAIGRTMRTGVPMIVDDLSRDESAALRRAHDVGLRSVLTMPVIEDGAIRAVVTMYFGAEESVGLHSAA